MTMLAPEQKIWPVGGMLSPYERRIIVDPQGNGDATTIAEGLSKAVAASPASSKRILVRVMGGVYAESGLVVPSYVTLRGSGLQTSITGGMVTLYGRGVLENLGVILSGAPHVIGVRVIHEIASSAYMRNCVIQVYNTSASLNAPTSCVELTGTDLDGALLDVRDCDFYGRNEGNGVNSRAAIFRIMPGGAPLQSYRGHYKLSAGTPASAELVIGWNQGTHAYAQCHMTGTAAVFNRPSFYLLRNENTVCQHGAYMDIGHTGWIAEHAVPPDYGTPEALILDTRPNAATNLYRRTVRSLDADEVRVGGDTVGVDPPLIVGQYYDSKWMYTTSTTNLVHGTARTIPFRVKRRTNIDMLRIDVTTAAANATARLALYADDGAGNPGALLIHCGTVLGSVVDKPTIACVYTLLPGVRYHLYVGGESTSGTPAATFRSALGHAPFLPQTGNLPALGHTATHTPGSVPSTFVSSGYTTAPIRVQFRVAA